MDESLLIQDYRPRVLYYVLKQVRDRATAEEITQETLLIVIQAVREERVRDHSKLGSYIFGVARNLILNHRRKRSQIADAMVDVENEPGSWMHHPEAELLLQERRVQLQQALRRLSNQEKEILHRSIVEADSLHDIARDMNAPYVATRKRKSRAMEKLKNFFLELSQKRQS